jgi:hypothetical protein
VRRLRKVLIWTHRYLGIVLSAFFLMWFLTGIGMIYARGMPRLTPEVRLARLSPLDLSRVHIPAADAAHAAGVPNTRRTTLLTVLDRPAYRFAGRESPTVFADNGEVMPEIDAAGASAVAARFMDVDASKIPEPTVVSEPDQWTLQTRLPVYKVAVQDASGTELYISPQTAEVVQLTTRGSRTLAWVSTIPHFMYFRSLRLNTPMWNRVVVWVSGFGCVLAVVGIIIGILHFKPSKPLRLSRLSAYIPYTGWMRWHYILGLIFGILTLTWVFSGLLSMEPWDWTTADNSLEEATREAFPAGPGDLQHYPLIDPIAWQSVMGNARVKEIELVALMDEPHYIVRSASGLPPVSGPPDGGHQPYYVMRGIDPDRWVIAAEGLRLRREPFSAETIYGRLRKALPDIPAKESAMLTQYDSYYYSRDYRAPLPVLRMKMADADSTWLYVDPEVSQVVGRVNRLNRVERWLYNALHNLDFPFLYYHRPLWDGVVIVLSLGGAAVSSIGLLLGMRRLARGIWRTATSWLTS